METGRDNGTSACLRIAAAGDVHCGEHNQEAVRSAVEALRGSADLVLLAGDLTTHGEPEQGALLAAAFATLDVPIFAVLGNHDWHVDRTQELIAALGEGGIRVLDRDAVTCEVAGHHLGIVGLKGFVGGFPGSHLPDFGEPLLRTVYRETSRDVEALDRGLREIAVCSTRIVLLHYAPVAQTIAGEPSGIWAFLGSDRLGSPIAEHEPDLVLHGHAHAGTFQGAIGDSPVYNVSVPVMERDFWLFELDVGTRAQSPVH